MSGSEVDDLGQRIALVNHADAVQKVPLRRAPLLRAGVRPLEVELELGELPRAGPGAYGRLEWQLQPGQLGHELQREVIAVELLHHARSVAEVFLPLCADDVHRVLHIKFIWTVSDLAQLRVRQRRLDGLLEGAPILHLLDLRPLQRDGNHALLHAAEAQHLVDRRLLPKCLIQLGLQRRIPEAITERLHHLEVAVDEEGAKLGLGEKETVLVLELEPNLLRDLARERELDGNGPGLVRTPPCPQVRVDIDVLRRLARGLQDVGPELVDKLLQLVPPDGREGAVDEEAVPGPRVAERHAQPAAAATALHLLRADAHALQGLAQSPGQRARQLLRGLGKGADLQLA
mmetsp:Transcript_130259/g.405171  ORF Transcript_130259/g.405171 Transcript_130259/m.405171 type:complete len:345 (-) Transcript_130259:254-1288(-)